MKSNITFSWAVMRLIPIAQREVTIGHVIEFLETLDRLQAMLNKCPNIGETTGGKERHAVFHYFFSSTNIFICEYDQNDLMYGYAVLNGDLENSKWFFFSLSELTKTRQYNIDYQFQEQSIEAALHSAYPNYFKNPNH